VFYTRQLLFTALSHYSSKSRTKIPGILNLAFCEAYATLLRGLVHGTYRCRRGLVHHGYYGDDGRQQRDAFGVKPGACERAREIFARRKINVPRGTPAEQPRGRSEERQEEKPQGLRSAHGSPKPLVEFWQNLFRAHSGQLPKDALSRGWSLARPLINPLRRYSWRRSCQPFNESGVTSCVAHSRNIIARRWVDPSRRALLPASMACFGARAASSGVIFGSSSCHRHLLHDSTAAMARKLVIEQSRLTGLRLPTAARLQAVYCICNC